MILLDVGRWAKRIFLDLGLMSYRFQAFKDRNGIWWDAIDTVIMLISFIVAMSNLSVLGKISIFSAYFLQAFLILKLLSMIICWIYNKYVNLIEP